jgi:hypothetical protein
MMKLNTCLWYAVALTILAVILGLIWSGRSAGSRGIVAVVNGTQVFYDDIYMDPEVVRALYGGELTASQIATKIEEHAGRRLRQAVREAIFKQKIEELGITASRGKIDQRVDELFQRGGVTAEDAVAVSSSAKALREALAACIEDPSEQDTIYQEKLADTLITREQWRVFRASFDTPDKLQELAIPTDVNDMKANTRESARKDILYRKLKDRITKDVSVSNSEIDQAYANQYRDVPDKPPLEEVRDTIRLRLLARKKREAEHRWWREQYRAADIEIMDPRLKNAVESLQTTN